MHNILIETVLNGWKVRVGCKEVVFTDVETLCSELRSYLTDPQAVQKRYLESSVNAKHCFDGAQQEAAVPPMAVGTERTLRAIERGIERNPRVDR